MKKLLLSASALFALVVGSADAQDLVRPVYSAAPVVCATCDWNGFYVGFNVGESRDWSSSQDSWTWFNNYPAGTSIGVGGGPVTILAAPTTFTTTFNNQYRHDSVGLIGGLQWGYNWQFGRLLFGVEGDWSWSNEKDSVTYSAQPVHAIFPPFPQFFFAPNTTQGWTSEEKIDWLTTWRARLGWAYDSYLWYVTGGVAWAKIETNYSLFSSPGTNGDVTGVGAAWGLPGGAAGANFSTIKTGWVLGGGVETSIGALFGLAANNWTMKLEYLFVDLGNVNNAIGNTLVPLAITDPGAVPPAPPTPGPFATGTTAFSSSNHVYEQIIRVGVNYRFGGAAVAAISK
jgi:outer membrane immunogenic protein